MTMTMTQENDDTLSTEKSSGETAAHGTSSALDTAAGAVQDGLKSVSTKARDVMDAHEADVVGAFEKKDQILDAASDQVRENPLRTVVVTAVVAAALGYVLGILTRR